MNERTEQEVLQRLASNRATIFACQSPTIRECPSISVDELDRQITLRKWAKAVVSAPDDELVDSPEGFSADEMENAIINEMYRNAPPLVLGGQGRSEDEVLSKGLESFFVIMALLALVGLCFYFR